MHTPPRSHRRPPRGIRVDIGPITIYAHPWLWALAAGTTTWTLIVGTILWLAP
ncbi:hypothetical protein ACQSSU_20300 [Micromonospora echinospora]